MAYEFVPDEQEPVEQAPSTSGGVPAYEFVPDEQPVTTPVAQTPTQASPPQQTPVVDDAGDGYVFVPDAPSATTGATYGPELPTGELEDREQLPISKVGAYGAPVPEPRYRSFDGRVGSEPPNAGYMGQPLAAMDETRQRAFEQAAAGDYGGAAWSAGINMPLAAMGITPRGLQQALGTLPELAGLPSTGPQSVNVGLNNPFASEAWVNARTLSQGGKPNVPTDLGGQLDASARGAAQFDPTGTTALGYTGARALGTLAQAAQRGGLDEVRRQVEQAWQRAGQVSPAERGGFEGLAGSVVNLAYDIALDPTTYLLNPGTFIGGAGKIASGVAKLGQGTRFADDAARVAGAVTRAGEGASGLIMAPTNITTRLAGGPTVGASFATAGMGAAALSGLRDPKTGEAIVPWTENIYSWLPRDLQPLGQLAIPILGGMAGAGAWRLGGSGLRRAGGLGTGARINLGPVIVKEVVRAQADGSTRKVWAEDQNLRLNENGEIVNRAGKVVPGARVADIGEGIQQVRMPTEDTGRANAARVLRGAQLLFDDIQREGLRLAPPKEGAPIGEMSPQAQAASARVLTQLLDADPALIKRVVAGDQAAISQLADSLNISREVFRPNEVRAGLAQIIKEFQGIKPEDLLNRYNGDHQLMWKDTENRMASRIATEVGIKRPDWLDSSNRYKEFVTGIQDNPALKARFTEALKNTGADMRLLDMTSKPAQSILDNTSSWGAAKARATTDKFMAKVDNAWKAIQNETAPDGTAWRGPDVLDPRLAGGNINAWMDSMMLGKALMSVFYLQSAPRYYVNNLFGNTAALLLGTQGRFLGYLTEKGGGKEIDRIGLSPSAKSGVLTWLDDKGMARDVFGERTQQGGLPASIGGVSLAMQRAGDAIPRPARMLGEALASPVTLTIKGMKGVGDLITKIPIFSEPYARHVAFRTEAPRLYYKKAVLDLENMALQRGATPEVARAYAVEWANRGLRGELGNIRNWSEYNAVDLTTLNQDFLPVIEEALRRNPNNPNAAVADVRRAMDAFAKEVADVTAKAPDTVATQLANDVQVRPVGAAVNIAEGGRPLDRFPASLRVDAVNLPDNMSFPARRYNSELVAIQAKLSTERFSSADKTAITKSASMMLNFLDDMEVKARRAGQPVEGLAERRAAVQQLLNDLPSMQPPPKVSAKAKPPTAVPPTVEPTTPAASAPTMTRRGLLSDIKTYLSRNWGEGEVGSPSAYPVAFTPELHAKLGYNTAAAELNAAQGKPTTPSLKDGAAESSVIGNTDKLLARELTRHGLRSPFELRDAIASAKKAVELRAIAEEFAKTKAFLERNMLLPEPKRPYDPITGKGPDGNVAREAVAVPRAVAADIMATLEREGVAAYDRALQQASVLKQGEAGAATPPVVPPLDATQPMPTPIRPPAAIGEAHWFDIVGSQDAPAFSARANQREVAARQAAQAADPNYRPPANVDPNDGWKIHLNAPPDINNPLTRQIVDYLVAEDVIFKVGKGGDDGQGITAYTGARTRDIAQAIDQRFGAQLGDPALGSDRVIAVKVAGRFVPTRAFETSAGLAHYGVDGIPIRRDDALNNLYAASPENRAQALQRGDAIMRQEYGSYYSSLLDQPTTQPSLPPTVDPRPLFQQVAAEVAPARIKVERAAELVAQDVAALPAPLRANYEALLQQLDQMVNDPKLKPNAGPVQKLAADLRALSEAKSVFERELAAAKQRAGLGEGLDPVLAREELRKLPDPIDPQWEADGVPYPGKVREENGVYLTEDGRPATFRNSFEWALDTPNPVTHAQRLANNTVAGVEQAVLRAKNARPNTGILPVEDVRASIKDAQAYAVREGENSARAMMFGYDDRSIMQYAIDHYSPYSYWTISHMLQTARMMAANPASFYIMAKVMGQWAEENKHLPVSQRWTIRMYDDGYGNEIRFNPFSLFPFATNFVASLVSDDPYDTRNPIIKAAELFGISPHFPIQIAAELNTTRGYKPATEWLTGSQPGESRARSAIPQTELIRLFTGGKVDIERGFREFIYGTSQNSIDNYYAAQNIQERVKNGELTETQAKQAYLSAKEGKPNEVWQLAMETSLKNRAIPAGVRYAGGPIQQVPAERRRLDDAGKEWAALIQKGAESKTEREEFLKKYPDLVAKWSANDDVRLLRIAVPTDLYRQEDAILDAKYLQQMKDLSDQLTSGQISGVKWSEVKKAINTNKQFEVDQLKAKYPDADITGVKTADIKKVIAEENKNKRFVSQGQKDSDARLAELEQQTKEKALKDGFYAIQPENYEKDGEINWKAYYGAVDTYLATLPAQDREFLLTEKYKNETPAERYYRTIVAPLAEQYRQVPQFIKGSPEEQSAYAKILSVYGEARYAKDASGKEIGTAAAGREALVKAGLARNTQEAGGLYSKALDARNPARAVLRNSPEFAEYRRFYADSGATTAASSTTAGVSGTIRTGSAGGAVPSAGRTGGSGQAPPSRAEVDAAWNEYNRLSNSDRRAAAQFRYDNFDKLYTYSKSVPERPQKPPSGEQYAARDQLSAMSQEYQRLKAIDQRQASAYWSNTASERARLEAIRDGKKPSLAPPVVTTTRTTTTSAPRAGGGGGGGGGGAPRPAGGGASRPTTPAPHGTIGEAVSPELKQGLIAYYQGRGELPDRATLEALRRRFSLSVPAGASLEQWLAALSRFIIPAGGMAA